MYMHLETITLQGVTCTCHRLAKIEITADGAAAIVNSFADENSGLVVWQDVYPVPFTTFEDGTDPNTAVHNFLISTTGPFGGGTLVTDPNELDQLKAQKTSNVNALRDRIANSICTTPSGIVDCDAVAKSNILGAVSAAMQAQSAGATFGMDWRLHDNSTVELDAAAMIAVGNAVLAFVQSCYQRSWTLKAQVAAAADADMLNAIDIKAGWPS